MSIQLSDIQIPTGCTHWVKKHFDKSKPVQYSFYKQCGPNSDEVFIWFKSKWMRFDEYQDWLIKHTPIKHRVTVPNLDRPCFNRHCETANDKIRKVKEKYDATTI